jgi:phosphate transport system substrate-binding protein
MLHLRARGVRDSRVNDMGSCTKRGRTAATLALLVLFAACSSDSEVDGAVTIVGSSTLRPFMSRVAGAFVEKNPRAQVSLDAPGTGPGLFLFCDGRTPIATASRGISSSEKDACRANGVRWIELPVALDAIVAVAHRDTGMECVTTADLYALTGPEANGVDDWAAAAPVADTLGSTTDLPDTSLQVITPPDDSGTVSLYVDLVIESLAGERDQAVVLRPDHLEVESDLLVSDRVRATPGALGILGFGAWRDASFTRALSVDAGEGCVKPSSATVADGSYPLSRELYVYVDAAEVDRDATLSRFVDHLTSSDVLEAAGAAGAVPLSPSAADRTQARWRARGRS